MTRFIGHDEAWRAWRGAAASGRMHHGWLLAGPEGLGKSGFARLAAIEWVGGGDGAPTRDHHPDILFVTPLPATDDDARKQAEGKPFVTKRSISVDQVRQMQRRLVTRPTLGDRRAVVIDAADELEKAAVNALLKSLEEPPVGTIFLIVVHRLGRLLPTVRSRCQILRFAPLDATQLAGAMATDPNVDMALLSLSGGSPGAAMAYADLGLGAVAATLRRLIDEGDPDMVLRGQLALALGARPTREALLATIELARRTLVDRLSAASTAERLAIVEIHQHIVRLGAQAPTYNFEPSLLLSEIGGLLASVTASRERAN